MKVLMVITCWVFVSISVPGFAQQTQDEAQAIEMKKKALELELINAQQKYKEQHPNVLRLQRELLNMNKLVAERNRFAESFKAANGPALGSLKATVSGTFWRNPKWVDMLGLSADQQSRMDDIFQQYRLKLIDLSASLQKEELILEPFLGGSRPSAEAESKILTQIDRIADARAELEKANSRMLIQILQVLSPEQWSKLPIQTKKGMNLLAAPGK
jgi:hypothetical protein